MRYARNGIRAPVKRIGIMAEYQTCGWLQLSWECCGGNGSLRIPIITITGLSGAPYFRTCSETQLSKGHVHGNVACPRPTYQPDWGSWSCRYKPDNTPLRYCSTSINVRQSWCGIDYGQNPSQSEQLLNCDVASIVGRTATSSKGVRVGNLMIIHCSYTLMSHMCVPPTWLLVQLLSASWVMRGS